MNIVNIEGIVQRVSNIRATKTGRKLTKMSVVIDHNGWKSFVDVIAYDGLAEKICDNIRGGDIVGVTGALKQDCWKNNGMNVSKISILAERIEKK